MHFSQQNLFCRTSAAAITVAGLTVEVEVEVEVGFACSSFPTTDMLVCHSSNALNCTFENLKV
jgi:hypothetical protein